MRAITLIPPRDKGLERAVQGAWITAFAMTMGWPYAHDALLDGKLHLLAHLPQRLVIGWFCAFGLGLILLTVGFFESRMHQRDVMTAFWSLVVAAISTAAICRGWFLPPDWATANLWIAAFYLATAVAALVSTWLTLRGVPMPRLPDPSKVPGMPMAGPASPAAAHATINRRRSKPKRQVWAKLLLKG